jgi:beta-N-acetylhexosaminidase
MPKKIIFKVFLVGLLPAVVSLSLAVFKINQESAYLDKEISTQQQIASKLGFAYRARPEGQLDVKFSSSNFGVDHFYNNQHEYLEYLKQENYNTFNSKAEKLKDIEQNIGLKKVLIDNLDLGTKVGSPPESKNFQIWEADIKQVDKLIDTEDSLTNYNSRIDQEISQYKQVRQQNGDFSNELWSYTDNDLMQMVSQMSTAQKLSQVLFVGIDFASLTQNKKIELEKVGLPNVIIMGSNIQNEQQIAKLNKDLQSTSPKIPLFIGVDQEGGVVKRISWDNTLGQKTWSKLNDIQICEIGTSRAGLLKKIGFNFNFSPVVDLTNPNPKAFINERTISSDPEMVTQKAQSYINCHQKEGVLTSLKHFPGHGSSANDTHTQLANVFMTKEEWLARDGIPFIKLKNSSAIMVGHLIYNKIDPLPASQSQIFMKQILKDQMQYEGLVITDDLKMLNQVTGKSDVELVKNALNSGADIAMYITDDNFTRLKLQLENEVSSGNINVDTLDKAVFNVLKAKRSLK